MLIRNINPNTKNNINFKGLPSSKIGLAIKAKINELTKLSDHTLIESEKIINNLKVINKKYDVIINEKGLSIVEYTINNLNSSVEKITTFTPKNKKIVVTYKKDGYTTFEMYDSNDNLIKTANSNKIKDVQAYTTTLQPKQTIKDVQAYTTTLQPKQTIKNTKNKERNTQTLHKKIEKPYKQKIYYHSNSRKIETILNLDEKGNIISNQTYNRMGKLTSETIFKDSIPVTKTIYNNSRKKVVINYNMFGSFINAREFDKYGEIKSIIRDVRPPMQLTDSKVAYEKIEYLSGGRKIKSEYDRKGIKLTQKKYNINNKLIDIIHIKPEPTNNNSNINLFNFFKFN